MGFNTQIAKIVWHLMTWMICGYPIFGNPHREVWDFGIWWLGLLWVVVCEVRKLWQLYGVNCPAMMTFVEKRYAPAAASWHEKAYGPRWGKFAKRPSPHGQHKPQLRRMAQLEENPVLPWRPDSCLLEGTHQSLSRGLSGRSCITKQTHRIHRCEGPTRDRSVQVERKAT